MPFFFFKPTHAQNDGWRTLTHHLVRHVPCTVCIWRGGGAGGVGRNAAGWFGLSALSSLTHTFILVGKQHAITRAIHSDWNRSCEILRRKKRLYCVLMAESLFRIMCRECTCVIISARGLFSHQRARRAGLPASKHYDIFNGKVAGFHYFLTGTLVAARQAGRPGTKAKPLESFFLHGCGNENRRF